MVQHCDRISLLFRWLIFHCMHIPPFICAFIHGCIFGLSPSLGHGEQCFYEQGCADNLFEILLSVLLDIYPEVILLDHLVILFLIF